MKRGDLMAIACAAVAGCALLAYVLPRAHPAASWNIHSDRPQSIVKAHEISAALGVETSAWRVTAAGNSDEKRGYFAERHPADGAARRFTPVYPTVHLAAPGRAEGIVVRLSAAGEVNLWEHTGALKSPTASSPADAAQAHTIAANALQCLAGPDTGGFRLVTDAAPARGNLLFAWERAGLLTERFEATVDGSTLVKAELKPVYKENIDATLESRKRYVDWLDIAAVVLIYIAGTVLAIGVYIYWAVRRAVKHRFVLALTAVCITGSIISWFNWDRFEEHSNVTIGDTPAGAWLGGVLILVFLILFYIALCGAMDAVAPNSKLATLRSVFSRTAFNRRTGISVLTGLLCGPLLAAVPLWISSWHLLGSEQTGDYDASLIYSIYPALQSLRTLISPALLGLFGVGAGFLARVLRKPAAAYAVLFVLGTLLFGSIGDPSETSPLAYVLKGALVFLIYLALFQRFDVLAVLSAGYSAHVIWSAAVPFLQQARSLHVSGITALTILAGFAVCAALVAWRGRDLAVEANAAYIPATSQRESLMAEFSIAHRVQQQMLPENPPEIPGCTIAASCHPAREVGGDLFDFLKLPDGRWGIGVGDVSGKGVPAALYMTLTKGLLAATTQDSSDLLDIVANVNDHFHTVAERKTFVTLALGAFDPKTRCFDHVRAGHNPIVWRRPATNATSLLTSRGIGLGMASRNLFRRATELECLQLNQDDLLVFYSDGLTEAMNSEQEQFGEERLMRAVEDADHLDATAVRELILSKVKAFLNGIPAQDDMTLVVLRVN